MFLFSAYRYVFFVEGIHGRIRIKFQIVGDLIKPKKVIYKAKLDDGRFKIMTLRNSTDKSGSSNSVLLEVSF